MKGNDGFVEVMSIYKTKSTLIGYLISLRYWLIRNEGARYMRFGLTVLAVVTSVGLSGCLGPAGKNSSPNMIQRSAVLSSNPKSITIEHSKWGKPIAFGTAEKHCAKYDKFAVYQSGSQQYGPDLISTWACE